MGTPGRATVERRDYRAYINSDAWRAVRERYWASKMYQDCYCCGARRRPGFHLHHRTYKNLGNERLMDLVPVCPDCHDEVHRIYRADPKWKRIGLWGLTKHVARKHNGELIRKGRLHLKLLDRGIQPPGYNRPRTRARIDYAIQIAQDRDQHKRV